MPIIPTAWTLSYECFFYIVVIVLIVGGEKCFWNFSTVWVLLIILKNLFWGMESGLVINFIFDELFLEFFFGVLVAIVVKKKLFFENIHGRVSIIVGGSMLGIMWLGTNLQVKIIESIPRVIGFGIPFALIIWGMAMKPEDKIKPEKKMEKVLRVLGDASYSLYLTHYMVILVVNYLFEMINVREPMLRFVFVSVACVVVGLMAYYIVERPLTKKISKC